MADPDRPLLADATDEITQLGSDLLQIADLRWKLARLELEAAVSSVKRLVILAVVAATMVLTALPILVVGAVHFLPDDLPDWAQAGSLLTVGLLLLLAAIFVSWWARRRFLREFVGLEESLEELREDLVWLQEWSGRGTREGK